METFYFFDKLDLHKEDLRNYFSVNFSPIAKSFLKKKKRLYKSFFLG